MSIVTKRVLNDLADTEAYLVRWSLWLPFGCSIKMHHILRRDADRCAHDHPWLFLRVILWGGYWERCGQDNRLAHRKPWRPWAPWRLYFCSGAFRHRIVRLPRGHSWTLVFCGPRYRHWGFFTRLGHIHWRSFIRAARQDRVLWCDDGRALDRRAIGVKQTLENVRAARQVVAQVRDRREPPTKEE